MNLYIASDHAGFEMKAYIRDALLSDGHNVTDLGPENLDPVDDYPKTVSPVAEKVVSVAGSFGIVIGGSGQGEAIEVNRTKGVRAVVYYGGPLAIVTLSREHNDANILSLGARFVENVEALDAVRLWLKTPFSGEERHVRRIKELDQ